jgi:hypothetical protein
MSDIGSVDEVCGDGVVNGAEQCDGQDLGGRICTTEGFSGGTLACKADCTLDTTGCESCGDGVVNGSEACDGAALDGKTCQSEGFDSGALACDALCQLDLSGCQIATCGNGSLDEKEPCEGTDLGGKTCAQLGFDGGELTCDDNCALNTSACFRCGDGVINGTEQCDGSQLGGKTCKTQGFDGGALGCTTTCTFHTAACVKCGDGVVNGAEQCDGSKLGGKTCKSLGYAGGTLACKSDCTLDTAACTSAPPPDQGPAPDLTAADKGAAADTQPPVDAKPTVDVGPGPVGFPGPGNTGVPAGVTLVSSGSVKVTQDGTVLDGKDIKGDVDIQAQNVVLKNCRVVVSGSYWGIIIRSGSLTVTDCEIYGGGDSGQGIFNPYQRPLTVKRCDISGFADGIMSDVGLVEDNYIHDLQGGPGSHHDGFQNGGGGPLTIRHNTILNPHGETSAIALFQDFGVPHDVLIENNLLGGGGYTVYGGAGSKGTATNIKVLNNQFSKKYFAKGGQWGPVAYWDSKGAGNTWNGNTWEGTSQVVSP